ncbi:DMT family transporter [Aurantibacillus circumpalustris]|uniref:DMT family transporter n=1 Tax=Aurantibacillus circumpalustris TaxID=3036359 RepID=UPI00295BB59E|nr:DMT family transporter [Aurantibacillus circumpalustris]
MLHVIVFIWGFSPILGRYITANAWQLVWFRILITVGVMFLYLKFTKHSLKISSKHFWQLSGIGLIIMVHWLAFYEAIKVSNVSVTMVAFSTGTLFSSIIEPIFFKRRVRFYELVIGLIIIAAITMIFSIETEYWWGITLGIIAAFTSSLFGVFNSILAHQLKSGVLSFYELSAAVFGLTIFIFVKGDFNSSFFVLDNASVVGILVLSIVCTVFPFIAAVGLSKHISPYTIVLTVNLETVYGIIWAILFFKENQEVKPSFYIGVFIILFAIFLNSYLRKLSDRRMNRIP